MLCKLAKDLVIGDVYTVRSPNSEESPELFNTYAVSSLPTSQGMLPGMISHRAYVVGKGNRSFATEDMATDALWVLDAAERAALREVCGHPTQLHWHGHIPGRAMGGTWINGTDFTDCGVCSKRMF